MANRFSYRLLLRLFRLRLVGAGMVLALILLLIFGLHTPACATRHRMVVKGNFTSVEGVKKGTLVTLAGIKVGEVCSITYLPNRGQVQLTMSLRNDLNLANDSSFGIISYGLASSKVVAILPGGSFDNLVAKGGADGDITYTTGSVPIEKILLMVLQRAEAQTGVTPKK
ncbi:MAG: MlaD family protein [Alphaproteobacteria bacterium]|nr:MlaD family protein [Alphaproteobacteria bacterium]